jgi:hypothetical protein
LKLTPEPAQPLFRDTMGEGFGLLITLGRPLQGVIPRSRSGAQAFFDIAPLQDALRIMGALGPKPGLAIRLQFHAHL